MPINFIDNQTEFEKICENLKELAWIGLDTEFIGENTFYTELCLIQVSSEIGIFLFDPLKIISLDPFLKLLSNSNILKIVHAGDNDFRIFYEKFGVIPSNVFDTQLASGFLGYRYPISFRDLVLAYLNKEISKAYSLVDWKKRPLPDHFLNYAINDVLYLFPLYEKINKELLTTNRSEWYIKESKKFYTSDFYQTDPYKDYRKSQLPDKLDTKHKIFFFRLLNWRNTKAKEQNLSKEAILPSKQIPFILKGISTGKSSLEQSRRIPEGLIKKNIQEWLTMFSEPPEEWELQLIKEMSTSDLESMDVSIKFELFYTAIQLYCFQNKIAVELVLPRSVLKELKFNVSKGIQILTQSWRNDFLGLTFIHLFQSIGEMKMEIRDNKITFG